MEDSSSQMLTRFGSDFYRWIIQILSSPRRGYTRLRRENFRRRRVQLARLGGRRSLKLKRFPRLKFRWFSPFALLAKLRDAYVDLMLAASSRIKAAEFMAMGSFAAAIPVRSSEPFGPIQAKEYDTKVLVELYRSMTQNQLILPSCE